MRRSVRVSMNMHLKIVRLGDNQKKIIPGYARNISEGGMAAFAPAQFLPDERLEIFFTLPGSQREMRAVAVVRGIEKFQYGLEFFKLDENAKKLIAEHCREFEKSRPA